MGMLLGLLAIACGIGSLVCAIIILIELFKIEGVGLGILGIICGIYAFIWGWMKVPQHGKRNVMVAWTAFLIGSIVLNVLAAAMMASSTPQTY